ncbi:hypothetical protein PROFUN_15770, partial [Planoprotostelium fungivorum]
ISEFCVQVKISSFEEQTQLLSLRNPCGFTVRCISSREAATSIVNDTAVNGQERVHLGVVTQSTRPVEKLSRQGAGATIRSGNAGGIG